MISYYAMGIKAFCIIFLFGCGHSKTISNQVDQDVCPENFYSDDLKNNIIEKTIRSRVGNDVVYFDIQDPTFYQRRPDLKEIMIASTLEVQGKRASYEESFVFVYDCKMGKIIEYYMI